MAFLSFIWSWIASAMELLGVWKVGSKKKIGFILNMIGNLIWIAVAIFNLPAQGLLLVVIPAFFINLRNYIKWYREEREFRNGKE